MSLFAQPPFLLLWFCSRACSWLHVRCFHWEMESSNLYLYRVHTLFVTWAAFIPPSAAEAALVQQPPPWRALLPPISQGSCSCEQFQTCPSPKQSDWQNSPVPALFANLDRSPGEHPGKETQQITERIAFHRECWHGEEGLGGSSSFQLVGLQTEGQICIKWAWMHREMYILLYLRTRTHLTSISCRRIDTPWPSIKLNSYKQMILDLA